MICIDYWHFFEVDAERRYNMTASTLNSLLNCCTLYMYTICSVLSVVSCKLYFVPYAECRMLSYNIANIVGNFSSSCCIFVIARNHRLHESRTKVTDTTDNRQCVVCTLYNIEYTIHTQEESNDSPFFTRKRTFKTVYTLHTIFKNYLWNEMKCGKKKKEII